jgi:hypothetical protein
MDILGNRGKHVSVHGWQKERVVCMVQSTTTIVLGEGRAEATER